MLKEGSHHALRDPLAGGGQINAHRFHSRHCFAEASMAAIVERIKHEYWGSRERFIAWMRRNRPEDVLQRFSLRLRAWRQPIFEREGIQLRRTPFLSVPVLESFESDSYEKPEARIVQHALKPNDIVLELGTGLGFISALCAKNVGSERIYTFEANPALEPIIQKNYILNDVSPHLEICLLGEADGEVTFYLMKNFWSSSIVKRHSRARSIQVPMRSFNDEVQRIRPSFLIIDIEGGESDFIRYARLDGISKVCIELHPHVIGVAAVAEVVDFFVSQGFHEVAAISDANHKLYQREPASIVANNVD